MTPQANISSYFFKNVDIVTQTIKKNTATSLIAIGAIACTVAALLYRSCRLLRSSESKATEPPLQYTAVEENPEATEPPLQYTAVEENPEATEPSLQYRAVEENPEALKFLSKRRNAEVTLETLERPFKLKKIEENLKPPINNYVEVTPLEDLRDILSQKGINITSKKILSTIPRDINDIIAETISRKNNSTHEIVNSLNHSIFVFHVTSKTNEKREAEGVLVFCYPPLHNSNKVIKASNESLEKELGLNIENPPLTCISELLSNQHPSLKIVLPPELK